MKLKVKPKTSRIELETTGNDSGTYFVDMREPDGTWICEFDGLMKVFPSLKKYKSGRRLVVDLTLQVVESTKIGDSWV